MVRFCQGDSLPRLGGSPQFSAQKSPGPPPPSLCLPPRIPGESPRREALGESGGKGPQRNEEEAGRPWITIERPAHSWYTEHRGGKEVQPSGWMPELEGAH